MFLAGNDQKSVFSLYGNSKLESTKEIQKTGKKLELMFWNLLQNHLNGFWWNKETHKTMLAVTGGMVLASVLDFFFYINSIKFFKFETDTVSIHSLVFWLKQPEMPWSVVKVADVTVSCGIIAPDKPLQLRSSSWMWQVGYRQMSSSRALIFFFLVLCSKVRVWPRSI